jgi:hypothetical protein
VRTPREDGSERGETPFLPTLSWLKLERMCTAIRLQFMQQCFLLRKAKPEGISFMFSGA